MKPKEQHPHSSRQFPAVVIDEAIDGTISKARMTKGITMCLPAFTSETDYPLVIFLAQAGGISSYVVKQEWKSGFDTRQTVPFHGPAEFRPGMTLSTVGYLRIPGEEPLFREMPSTSYTIVE